MTTRIVIDTNIYISAIFWGGKPRVIIDKGRSNEISIFVSEEIKQEISEKLYEKFKLDKEDVENILLDISVFTKTIKIVNQLQVISDDPDDDKFLECAVTCNAEYIVSGDSHLLNLKEYKGIKILNASRFLAKISKYSE